MNLQTWNPYFKLTCPAAMLIKIFGIKNGFTSLYPLLNNRSAVVYISFIPFNPIPTATPWISQKINTMWAAIHWTDHRLIYQNMNMANLFFIQEIKLRLSIKCWYSWTTCILLNYTDLFFVYKNNSKLCFTISNLHVHYTFSIISRFWFYVALFKSTRFF